MNFLALSDDAAQAARGAGAASCQTVPPTRLVDSLLSTDASVCIVADVHLIDDAFARAINAAQRITHKAVGIIPYSPRHPDAIARLVQPSPGCDPTKASYVAYSVDNDAMSSLNPHQISGTVKRYSKDNTQDVFEELQRGATCFAGQLNGRQTFCFLDSNACIHPDTFGQIEGTKGILTPENCTVEHFLIQSCHSPFRWADFGETYLTVPLAFILRGHALSFIASTRVQSLVPDLISLYLSCANAGMIAGEMLLELNAHCRALRIDEDPFILFGNPDLQIVHQSAAVQNHTQAIDHVSLDRYRSNLYALGSILQNMRFSRDQILDLFAPLHVLDPTVRSLIGNARQHLRAIQRKGQSATTEESWFLSRAAEPARQLENMLNNFLPQDRRFSENLNRVSRAFKAQTLRFRSLAAISATPAISADLEAFTTALLRMGEKNILHRLSGELVALWKQKQGYYYFFSDRLECLFLPQSPYQTSSACPSCGSALLSKPQEYIGLTPTAAYEGRQQLVCARCLTVRDASALHSPHIEANFSTVDDRIEIEMFYRNHSSNPEWLFGYFHLNDPNNISANLAQTTFGKLLAEIVLESTGWEPRTLAPGEMWKGTISIRNVPPDLFYLLIECHLFIDGCWNWLFFTKREPQLDRWLKSPEYSAHVAPRQRLMA